MSLEFSLFEDETNTPMIKREYFKLNNISAFDIELGPEVLIEGTQYRF
jgi:hypothetical protein